MPIVINIPATPFADIKAAFFRVKIKIHITDNIREKEPFGVSNSIIPILSAAASIAEKTATEKKPLTKRISKDVLSEVKSFKK